MTSLNRTGRRATNFQEEIVPELQIIKANPKNYYHCGMRGIEWYQIAFANLQAFW
jgi:hypothetical protein